MLPKLSSTYLQNFGVILFKRLSSPPLKQEVHEKPRQVSSNSKKCWEVSESLWIWLPQINLLSANRTKWSKTLKQFVGSCKRIFWIFLSILWDGASRVKNRNEIEIEIEILKIVTVYIM